MDSVPVLYLCTDLWTRGGYSLNQGYYLCSAISTPPFQVSGNLHCFDPYIWAKCGKCRISAHIFVKIWRNVKFRPHPLFLTLSSFSSEWAVLRIPLRNPTENTHPAVSENRGMTIGITYRHVNIRAWFQYSRPMFSKICTQFGSPRK